MVKKTKKQGENLAETLKFGLTSAGILVLAVLFLQAVELKFLQEIIAVTTAFVFNLELAGNTMKFSGSTLIINNYCTGFYSIALFASILFPFKKIELKERTVFFLKGAVILFGANMARVGLIAFALMNYGFEAGELVHIASWLAMGLIVFSLWVRVIKQSD